MNPFENILDDAALDVLTAIGSSSLADRFYLAGGTALALQIGHRRSNDLDFFQLGLLEKIDFAAISGAIRKVLGSKRAVLEEKQPEQIMWRINGTRVTFLAYPFGLFEPLLTGDTINSRLHGVYLAPVREIAMMKAYCLGRRAAYRDYIDIYFLLQKELVSLEYIMTNSPHKFTFEGETLFSPRLFLEQLVFFEDLPDRKAALDMVHGRYLTEEMLTAFLIRKAREVLAQVGERRNGR